MNLWKDLKVKIRVKEPLKKHTTFRIGGPMQYFAEPGDTEALKLLLKRAKRANIRILVLGAGSNILAADNVIKGLVLRLNSRPFKRIVLKNNKISAGCAISLPQLLLFAGKRGLSGFEFLAGIPGTVGGALMMNAGARGRAIGDTVATVTAMDYSGREKVLKRSAIKFGYRNSGLNKYIILTVSFKVGRRPKKEIIRKIEENLSLRLASQDLSKPSAGCVFKNPKGLSAGILIDECGLKGKSCGNARISDRHANFILNLGSAKASDVLRLMKLAKNKVKKEYGVTLEPEIKIWR